MADDSQRQLGFFGATLIGVGAIVGGGILALAGVAFGAAGPGAMLAFLLNGGIAFLTALSFAELSAMFPQSGGAYTFAKKVLSVRAGFILGWVVWFASIVAGVLYALGFAAYAVIVLEQAFLTFGGSAPSWLTSRLLSIALAIGATFIYTVMLTRPSRGGGDFATIGKVIAFGVLIAFGLWVFIGTPSESSLSQLSPFFPTGFAGVFSAMGFTFIALQGFDLIAAAAGEIKTPEKTVPRAMFLSLAIALLIYMPLLFITVTVGVPEGESILSLGQQHPETLLAVAAQTYLGPLGFWLVVVAALLSMLSALQANLFAASRIALSMARDRTLPHQLSQIKGGVPVRAVLLSALALIVIMLLLPNVAAAGAAASLIFLVMFTLTHGISIVARRRADEAAIPFKTPLFPLIPLVGGLACAVLATFQGIVVPSAGFITVAWIVLGVGMYVWLFAGRARALDALAEARDPYLLQLRGRNPLVLVPIANPANAEAMVRVANAVAPPRVGRVMLLSILPKPSAEETGSDSAPPQLLDAQTILRESLTTSFNVGLFPQALTTVSSDPWEEMARVAEDHACESLLVGFSQLEEGKTQGRINRLMSKVDADVLILRAPPTWKPAEVEKILVPVGGKGDQDILRARLLGSLGRTRVHEASYIRIVPERTTDASIDRARRALELLAADEDPGNFTVTVMRSDDPLGCVLEQAKEHDLIVLGSQRKGRFEKQLGQFALDVASGTDTALLIISRKG